MKPQAHRAHRRFLTVLVVLAVATGILSAVGSWNPPEPVQEPPAKGFYDQPPVPSPKGNEWAPKWQNSFRVNGFGTVYDAYQHSRAWYDSPKTWVYANETQCAQNPKWRCYLRDMGGWTAMVRPWKTTLKNLYAAIGPRLRKYLSVPEWHTVPSQKLLIISTHTGKWVEVWIADFCDCRQGTPGNSKDDSLIDLSPQVWAALGAYKNNKVPSWPFTPTTAGWRNDIEVRFIP